MINEVYDIGNPASDTVRVLDVLRDDMVVVVSLLKKNSLPFELPISSFDNAILNSSYPPVFIINPSEKQKIAADESWKIIGDFVSDTPDCYDKKYRSKYITAKSKECGLTRTQIQRLTNCYSMIYLL